MNPEKFHRSLPGHIRKAFRAIERFLPVVDIIIELLDARMPFSSRIHGLVEKLGKVSLVVLGKSDLADPEVTQDWIKWFESFGETCLPFVGSDIAATRRLHSSLADVFGKIGGFANRKVCRIMVIGIPNVGKSTLINSLAGCRPVRVANLPGVTRNFQWVKLGNGLELLDLPGVLDYSLLKKGDLLRLINSVPGPDEDPEAGVLLLLNLLKERGITSSIPGIEDGENFVKILEKYAFRKNFLLKGGKPDIRRSAKDILKRFQMGDFGRFSLETPQTFEKVLL